MEKSGRVGIIWSLVVIICLFVTIMLPSTAFAADEASVSATAEGSIGVPGDYNGDGEFNAMDIVWFKQYIMNPEHKYDSTYDLNSDNSVDAMDFSILKMIILGLRDFPVNPPKPGVLYVGRFDTSDPAGPKFAWSATTIKANFQGTGVSANLKSTGDNWFSAVVDGVVQTPVNVPSGTSAPVTLATGLTNGKHTIELVRRTEAWVGEVQFLGFNVTGGSLLAPPAPSARRIEFIGDSITCGYGNEGTSQYQSFTTKNENAYMAYGAITSRLLNADPVTVCWSGKGMVQNYGGDRTDLMPVVYPRILPYNTTLAWDTSKWIPQVVVINLGTNDFSTGSVSQETYTTVYSSFVGKIRSQYPDAHIYCAVGPMLGGDQLAKCRGGVSAVVSQKNTSGDLKIHLIEFPVQDAANGYGEDWHPSIKTHQLMADKLAARIKADLGW